MSAVSRTRFASCVFMNSVHILGQSLLAQHRVSSAGRCKGLGEACRGAAGQMVMRFSGALAPCLVFVTQRFAAGTAFFVQGRNRRLADRVRRKELPRLYLSHG